MRVLIVATVGDDIKRMKKSAQHVESNNSNNSGRCVITSPNCQFPSLVLIAGDGLSPTTIYEREGLFAFITSAKRLAKELCAIRVHDRRVTRYQRMCQYSFNYETRREPTPFLTHPECAGNSYLSSERADKQRIYRMSSNPAPTLGRCVRSAEWVLDVPGRFVLCAQY